MMQTRQTLEFQHSAPTPVIGLVQRACACGRASGPSSTCASCNRARMGVRGISDSTRPRISGAGSGKMLGSETKGFMESRFGHDFGKVRVHTDEGAAERARALDARAFTSGSEIFFGSGHFQPDTHSGRRLLAHELSHTIQQNANAPKTPAIQRKPNKNQGAVQGVNTGDPHLHDCRTLPDAGDLGTVLSAAQKSANEAVSGLQSKNNNWGSPAQSVLERATEMGLRKGFSMEADKSAWAAIGIPQTEIDSIDKRDKAAAQTILTNFQQIQSDVGNYSAANQCEQGKFTAGNPCLTCADEEHARHKRGVTAWVNEDQIGSPSSPIHLGPRFRGLPSAEEKADALLHELAHLQKFAASDRLTPLGASYYGCPVAPDAINAPRLMNPNEYLKIADSYRCFLLTQRTYKGYYEEEEKRNQQIKQDTSQIGQDPP